MLKKIYKYYNEENICCRVPKEGKNYYWYRWCFHGTTHDGDYMPLETPTFFSVQRD